MTAWWCKLPETGWQKELDALEHLIVDKGILERDVTEIDLRSPTHYFFVLQERREEGCAAGERDLNGRDDPLARQQRNPRLSHRPGVGAGCRLLQDRLRDRPRRAGHPQGPGQRLARKRRPPAGTVTSLELAEESIRDCVAAAENHADARIQNVLISVNCGQPVSVTSRAVMALDGALVSDAHLRALLADGRARCRAGRP